MTNKYYTVDFKPDMIKGNVSNFIASNKADAPFAADDVLFNWHAVQIPKGASKITSITAVIRGEDGGVQANARDINFYFAKSIDGVAPGDLGTVNATADGIKFANNLLGTLKLDSGDWMVGLDTLNVATTVTGTGGKSSANVVVEGEPNSGTTAGYNTLYVAAITGGSLDFSSGMLADGAIPPGLATTATTGVVVKTVLATSVCEPGDILYVHDLDTALGTVSEVIDGTHIKLTAVSAAAIADEDEIVNATPIRVILSLEK